MLISKDIWKLFCEMSFRISLSLPFRTASYKQYKGEIVFMKRTISLLIVIFLLFSCCALANEGPSSIIDNNEPLKGQAEYLGNIPAFDNYTILQGGCVTDRYGYFIMIDSTTTLTYSTTKSIVLKYDMASLTEVARSEVLRLGHANDITYLPATNELLIIHVTGQKVSCLDADTLELKQNIRLPLEAHALAYVPEMDRYVFAYDKAGMFFMSGELKGNKKIESSSMPITTTLITQGICADKKYVYHILWSSRSNEEEPESIIMVFDWAGNEVMRIPIGLKDYEPENISIVGNDFIIACNNYNDDGQAVFRLSLLKAE